MKNILLILSLIFTFMSCDKFGPQGDKRRAGKQEVVLTQEGDTIIKEYDDNGKLKSSIQIKNSFRNGQCFSYFENGNVKFEINYKEGVKDGLMKKYYRNGKLYRQTPYKMGVIDGIKEYFYDNGMLMAKVPVENDEIVPGTIEYDEKGQVINDHHKIIISGIDKMAFENKYILEVKLDPKIVKVDYKMYKKLNGKMVEYGINGKQKNGVAMHIIKVPPGVSLMEKIKFRATFKSHNNIPISIEKSYNLVAENRSF